mgnify:CR=1 FL=1
MKRRKKSLKKRDSLLNFDIYFLKEIKRLVQKKKIEIAMDTIVYFRSRKSELKEYYF